MITWFQMGMISWQFYIQGNLGTNKYMPEMNLEQYNEWYAGWCEDV